MKPVVVTRLQVSNFMRLKAIDITPDASGKIVLSGRNAQGKSSVLEAIWAALGGKSASPKKPVREGEESATARVEMGDIVVERTWLADGKTTLTVSNKDGARYPSPQSMLDELVSRTAFDPLLFMRQDAKRQAQLLRDVAGVDTSAAEDAVLLAFDARKEQNAIVKRLEGRLPEEPACPDAVDVESLNRELEQRREAEREHKDATGQHSEYQSAVDALRGDMAALDAQIAQLQDQRNNLTNQEIDLLQTLARQDKIVIDCAAAIEQLPRAEEEVRRELEQANAVFSQRAEHEAWTHQATELREEKQRAQALTSELEERRAALAKIVQDAEYPIDGLAVTANGVTYNGMPLDQCSTAEQLRISMAMAMATKPGLQVVHIREGSLLDSESLEIVHSLAQEKGFQVWIERVDESGKVGIVIEDGEVVSAAEEQAA